MSAVTVTRSSRATSSSNPGTFRMELASPEDWHALAELERACFPGDRISPRSWRSFLASQSAVVTVARSAGSDTARSTLIGAAVVLRRATTSVARLYSMAIATNARGRGVSAALLEDATQRMRDAGAAVLRLETRLDNVAAQRLFAKCGFVQRGRKASYYEDGEDALLYQKSLWSSGAAALGAPCPGRRRQTAAVVISKEY